MLKTYNVINASAGSGKTYAIITQLLSRCLGNKVRPEAIRKVLALTFTNKAANEMKSRILDWLDKFVSDDFLNCGELKSVQSYLNQNNDMQSLEELHYKSIKLRDYLLHHYSVLQISTLDKFNTRLVRSFSFELGLEHNFSIDIDEKPYLNEALERIFLKIGEDDKLTKILWDYLNFFTLTKSAKNLKSNLLSFAEDLNKDLNYFKLMQNKEFDWHDFETLNQKIDTKILFYEEKVKLDIQNLWKIFENSNYKIEDFAGGASNGLMLDVKKMLNYIETGKGAFFKLSEEGAINKYNQGASPNAKKIQEEIINFIKIPLIKRKEIFDTYVKTKHLELLKKFLLPMILNKLIQDELQLVLEENNAILLSKFNVLIHENLHNEPVPFIYEKVGERFEHFYLDEFQDTSTLQWANILPLRDDSIFTDAKQFSLVGDPKQSIYRFRGGDSKIFIDIINKKEKENVENLKNIVELKDNYRSSKNIVNFNNNLYNFTSTFLPEYSQSIFQESAIQNAKADYKGYVRTHLIQTNQSNDVFWGCFITKLLEDIQSALDNGFDFSDMCILMRDNLKISKCIEIFGGCKVQINGEDKNIDYISKEGLSITASPTVNALIQLLIWKNNPENRTAFSDLIFYLHKANRINCEDISSLIFELLQLSNPQKIHYLFTNFNLDLKDAKDCFNLYQIIEYFSREIGINDSETDYIVSFLEFVHDFCQNPNASISKFLEVWETKSSKIFIKSTANINAIKILTIHDSKGLEFPVVFLPIMFDKNEKKIKAWLNLSDEMKFDNQKLNSIYFNSKHFSFANYYLQYDEVLSEFVEENLGNNLIDRICLQYVATTRAEQQLFIYLESSMKKDSKVKNFEMFNYLFYEILPQIEVKSLMSNPFNLSKSDEIISFDFFETTQEEKLKNKIKPKFENLNSQKISNAFEKSLYKNKVLKIANPSKKYQINNPKVRLGIIIHEIFEKINSKKDVKKVLENYVLNGLIAKHELLEIKKRILAIMEDEKYKIYFEEGLEIMNEREIAVKIDDKIVNFRPDKLVKIDGKWIIIDFKTGEEKIAHQKQLITYKMALEKLNYEVSETFLIYL